MPSKENNLYNQTSLYTDIGIHLFGNIHNLLGDVHTYLCTYIPIFAYHFYVIIGIFIQLVKLDKKVVTMC